MIRSLPFGGLEMERPSPLGFRSDLEECIVAGLIMLIIVYWQAMDLCCAVECHTCLCRSMFNPWCGKTTIYDEQAEPCIGNTSRFVTDGCWWMADTLGT